MWKGPKMANMYVLEEMREGLYGQSSDSEDKCWEKRWEQWSGEHCTWLFKAVTPTLGNKKALWTFLWLIRSLVAQVVCENLPQRALKY